MLVCSYLHPTNVDQAVGITTDRQLDNGMATVDAAFNGNTEHIINTDDFSSVIAKLERYGGRTPLIASTRMSAIFSLSSGVLLRIDQATEENWGLSLIQSTGSVDGVAIEFRKSRPGASATRIAGRGR